MANQNVTFELKRGYSIQWLQKGIPILQPGEPGVELDTGQMKIGNGITPWEGLTYVGSVFSEEGLTFSGDTGSVLYYNGTSLSGTSGVRIEDSAILADSVGNNGASVSFSPTGDVNITPGVSGHTVGKLLLSTGTNGLHMDNLIISGETGGISIGKGAGHYGQSKNSIAIGNYTTGNYQPSNTIVLNVGDTGPRGDSIGINTGSIILNTVPRSGIQTGTNSIVLNADANNNIITNKFLSNSFNVSPVRVDINQTTPLAYNTVTGEIVQGSTFLGYADSVPFVNSTLNGGGLTVSSQFMYDSTAGLRVNTITDVDKTGAVLSFNQPGKKLGDINIFEGSSELEYGNVYIGNTQPVIFGGDVIPKSDNNLGSNENRWEVLHTKKINDINDSAGSSGFVLSCDNENNVKWVKSIPYMGPVGSIPYYDGSSLTGGTSFQFSSSDGLTLESLTISGNSKDTPIQIINNSEDSSCSSVIIGNYSPDNTPVREMGYGMHSVAVGTASGWDKQGSECVSIGAYAGASGQDIKAVSVGNFSGFNSQGRNAVAVGADAGRVLQSQYAVALGNRAGQEKQGDYAVAIGNAAGLKEQYANSIIINARLEPLNALTTGFYVSPINHVIIPDAAPPTVLLGTTYYALCYEPISSQIVYIKNNQ